jgi:hypothetical protein
MIQGGDSVILKTHVHVVELNVCFRRKRRVITVEFENSSQAGRLSNCTPDTRVRFGTEKEIGTQKIGTNIRISVNLFRCMFYYMDVVQGCNSAVET